MQRPVNERDSLSPQKAAIEKVRELEEENNLQDKTAQLQKENLTLRN